MGTICVRECVCLTYMRREVLPMGQEAEIDADAV